jgi:Leucine-rich repeat (LRR) protein
MPSPHGVCRLRALSEAVAGLPRLASLDCSDNPALTGLPDALGAHQAALAVLSVNNCRLESAPRGLALARGLIALSLNDNRLETLPENLFQSALLLSFEVVMYVYTAPIPGCSDCKVLSNPSDLLGGYTVTPIHC